MVGATSELFRWGRLDLAPSVGRVEIAGELMGYKNSVYGIVG